MASDEESMKIQTFSHISRLQQIMMYTIFHLLVLAVGLALFLSRESHIDYSSALLSLLLLGVAKDTVQESKSLV